MQDEFKEKIAEFDDIIFICQANFENIGYQVRYAMGMLQALKACDSLEEVDQIPLIITRTEAMLEKALHLAESTCEKITPVRDILEETYGVISGIKEEAFADCGKRNE